MPTVTRAWKHTFSIMVCKAGNTNKEIFTAADGTTNDALNKVVGRSTRTGYYLRKLLRQDISLDPNAKADQYHYTPRIRYTEIFLAYAEAAKSGVRSAR